MCDSWQACGFWPAGLRLSLLFEGFCPKRGDDASRQSVGPWKRSPLEKRTAGPGAIGVAVFAFERERQVDAAAPVAEIVLMNFLHTLKMKPERVAQTFGQNCNPVAYSL